MCAYEHRHTDTVLWTHSFSHTHSWTYLLMPDNMQTPPTCSYSPAYSLNPALSHLCVIHACSSVHVHALFRHAMSIHAWVLFYSMHMYSYWVFFFLMDPGAYWSVFISMVWHVWLSGWSAYYLQAHAVRGVNSCSAFIAPGPKELQIIRVHSRSIMS